MDKRVKSYIEHEIRNFRHTVQRLKEREYEIRHSTYQSDGVESGRNSARTVSDVTAMKAIAVVEDRQLARMKQVTNAIATVYDGMVAEKQELIDRYYWQTNNPVTWDGLAMELHITERTARRWRDCFVKQVADEMGLS